MIFCMSVFSIVNLLGVGQIVKSLSAIAKEVSKSFSLKIVKEIFYIGVHMQSYLHRILQYTLALRIYPLASKLRMWLILAFLL